MCRRVNPLNAGHRLSGLNINADFNAEAHPTLTLPRFDQFKEDLAKNLARADLRFRGQDISGFTQLNLDLNITPDEIKFNIVNSRTGKSHGSVILDMNKLSLEELQDFSDSWHDRDRCDSTRMLENRRAVILNPLIGDIRRAGLDFHQEDGMKALDKIFDFWFEMTYCTGGRRIDVTPQPEVL
ncbi:MAG: hypothetical protein GC136_06650 [Alphaproteobacteria bacterium]|nr:hypothetical protein [Alphaproteobacteria bacterium]